MRDWIFGVCATLAWSGLIYRLWVTRPPSSAVGAHRAFRLVFALLGAIFTISIASVSASIDRVVGVNNLAAIAIQVCIIAYTCAQRSLLAWWTLPAGQAAIRSRSYWRWLIVGLPIMITLLVIARVPGRSPHFIMENAGNPTIALYVSLYTTILTVNVVPTVRVCWTHRRITPDPWLRRGLFMIAIGSSLVLGYCAVRVSDVIAQWIGFDPSRWDFLVSLFAGVGTIIALIGYILPTAGEQLSSVYRWAGMYVDYIRLRPLWDTLRGEFGETVARNKLSARDRMLGFRDPEYLLYGRVVAIRDGLLALRPWMDPVKSDPLSFREDASVEIRSDAVAVAERIARALDAKRHNRSIDHQSCSHVDESVKDDHLTGEAKWLVSVSAEFRGLRKPRKLATA